MTKINSTDLVLNLRIPKDNILKDNFTLTVKNNSKRVLSISNPSCWSNSVPYLLSTDDVIIPSIKIKTNPKCMNEFIILQPDSFISVPFNYSLSIMYPQLETGLFNIYFIYQGEVKDDNGKIIMFNKTIKSSRQRIEI